MCTFMWNKQLTHRFLSVYSIGLLTTTLLKKRKTNTKTYSVYSTQHIKTREEKTCCNNVRALSLVKSRKYSDMFVYEIFIKWKKETMHFKIIFHAWNKGNFSVFSVLFVRLYSISVSCGFFGIIELNLSWLHRHYDV